MKMRLDIDNDLLTRAMTVAIRQGTGLTRLIEEGLELRIQSQDDAGSERFLAVPVYHGRGGRIAGIDPCSNASMLDAADAQTR